MDAKNKEPVFQMPDGSWGHAKDAKGSFTSKETAAVDYQFCCEWKNNSQLSSD